VRERGRERERSKKKKIAGTILKIYVKTTAFLPYFSAILN